MEDLEGCLPPELLVFGAACFVCQEDVVIHVVFVVVLWHLCLEGAAPLSAPASPAWVTVLLTAHGSADGAASLLT